MSAVGRADGREQQAEGALDEGLVVDQGSHCGSVIDVDMAPVIRHRIDRDWRGARDMSVTVRQTSAEDVDGAILKCIESSGVGASADVDHRLAQSKQGNVRVAALKRSAL